MSTAPDPVRVLVAEDSSTTRDLLVSLCRSASGMEVVGEAANGLQAVEMTARLRPSVVVMDIHMPVMCGFEATKRIMVQAPTPIVIVTADSSARDVEVGLRAVQVGALTVLPKPPAPDDPAFQSSADRLVSTVRTLSDVKVVRRWSSHRSDNGSRPMALPGEAPGVRIVSVAASTGGPAALYRLLERLPPDADAPVAVVQHIADGFAPGLVAWLGSGTPLPVKLAEDGEPLLAGTVYVAPDRRHLEVTAQRTVSLSQAPPVAGFRPSATALFRSVAASYGPSAAGVVLTGMGSDGLDGVRALREAGGRVLAQDEATSVVFGMPGVVVAAGLADFVAPVHELAVELTRLVARRVR